MKTASLKEIKKELSARRQPELVEYCLRLGKLKKENKELLHYLLFDAQNPSVYLQEVKDEIEQAFLEMNKTNIYWIKKSVRKILRNINRYIRFTASKEAEAQLLIAFCNGVIKHSIPVKKSFQLHKLYTNQLKKIEKALGALHPDLQFDLRKELIISQIN